MIALKQGSIKIEGVVAKIYLSNNAAPIRRKIRKNNCIRYAKTTLQLRQVKNRVSFCEVLN